MGRLPEENFDVRCPLALFPVSMDRTPTTITITYDDSRDALFNNVFLLAYFKFNNINKPPPQAVIEEGNISSFDRYVMNFYEENGIHIKASEKDTEKFIEYDSSEFPRFDAGDFQIQHNLII